MALLLPFLPSNAKVGMRCACAPVSAVDSGAVNTALSPFGHGLCLYPARLFFCGVVTEAMAAVLGTPIGDRSRSSNPILSNFPQRSVV